MRTLAVMAVLFLVVACQAPPPEMTEAERTQIEADVAAVMQQFMEGFNELNLEKINQTMHPDLMSFPLGGRLVNKSEYREYLDEWVADKESWKGSWHEMRVRVLSPNAAVFTGTYSDTIRYLDGQVRFYPQGAWVTLVERTPEGWKWSMGGQSASPFELISEG